MVIRNIEIKGRVGDYYSVEITGDGECSKSTKKNQQRRRILHLISVSNADYERALITIFLERHETGRTHSACECDICGAGNDHAINNLERGPIENRGGKDLHGRRRIWGRADRYNTARTAGGILRKIPDHHELIAMDADGT